MDKNIFILLIISFLSFSTSQAQDILISSDRNLEDRLLQDIALQDNISITLQEGENDILIDNTNNKDSDRLVS